MRDRASTAGQQRTTEIARLAKKAYNLVRFEHILCDTAGQVSLDGRAIPFTVNDTGGCAGLHLPRPTDGFYDFSELHYTVWLAYSQACAGGNSSRTVCRNTAIAKMWTAWQGRRLAPDLEFDANGKTYPLLSDWPSCEDLDAPLTHPENCVSHLLAVGPLTPRAPPESLVC